MKKQSAAGSKGKRQQPVKHLSIETAAEVKAVAYHQAKTLMATVTVAAPDTATVEGSEERAPLDLMVALDVSGSMSGTKIETLKQTMAFMVQQLGPRDRLCVCQFSHEARQLTPFSLMSEARKPPMEAVIQGLQADGGTSIQGAVDLAAQILDARRERNKVTSVLLLSDGQARVDTATVRAIAAKGATVHTFGFGRDHDAALLESIADAGNGTFSYIEDVSTVFESFGTVLGGLMSIVAQEVTVRLTAVEGTCISAVHTSYPVALAANRLSATVQLNDLMAGERRDLVLQLQVPALQAVPRGGRSLLLGAVVRYKDTTAEEASHERRGQLSLARPASPSAAMLKPNDQVLLQWHRVTAAASIKDALATATTQGDLAGARKKLQATRATLEAARLQGSDQVAVRRRGLVAQLQQCESRLTSRESMHSGGSAYFSSAARSHSMQRAAYQAFSPSPAGTAALAAVANPYQNVSSTAMMTKAAASRDQQARVPSRTAGAAAGYSTFKAGGAPTVSPTRQQTARAQNASPLKRSRRDRKY